jgi:hypothetical protein
MTATGAFTVRPSSSSCLVRAVAPSTSGAAKDGSRVFMSLQDIDDLEGAVAEAGRVIEPGGRFCIAIVLPLNSAGMFAGGDPTSPFVIEGSYLGGSYYADQIAREGVELTLVSAHRPLEAYANALARAGFVVERLREPAMPEHAVTDPSMRRWQRVPLFLHLRAAKL